MSHFSAHFRSLVTDGVQRDEAVADKIVATCAIVRPHPQVATAVGTECRYEIGVYAEIVLGEILEVATVISAQTVLGGKPDEAVGILRDGSDTVEGQPVVGGKMGEIPTFRTRWRGLQHGCRHGQQEQNPH